MKKITRDFSGNFYWEAYSNNLDSEFMQSLEEGLDVSQHEKLFYEIAQMPFSAEKEKAADALFEFVLNAEVRADYPYEEPETLEEIKKARKKNNIDLSCPDKETLYDKICGAWYGRICGCLLGKPLEGIRTNELIPLLKETGNYPLSRYVESKDITEEMCEKYSFGLKNECWADTVDCAPVDDDTNYTVMAQLLIEKYGRDFTSEDVANLWLNLQPRDAYFTAERVAFNNFINGFAPPFSAVYKNPFREWIGAQIRGDYFGFINPARPEKAAEMAFADASISHIKNGIYGEMFISAMISAAVCLDNIKDIISVGLAEIPEKSRLYMLVSEIVAMYENGKSFDDCFNFIHSKYDEHTSYGWCHTLSNAMIVTAALLYGEGDYSKSICLAVSVGFDTDCNGATVGAVVGSFNGIKGIDKKWTDVLNDTLDTSILGVGKVTIKELVDKTMDHIFF